MITSDLIQEMFAWGGVPLTEDEAEAYMAAPQNEPTLKLLADYLAANAAAELVQP